MDKCHNIRIIMTTWFPHTGGGQAMNAVNRSRVVHALYDISTSALTDSLAWYCLKADGDAIFMKNFRLLGNLTVPADPAKDGYVLARNSDGSTDWRAESEGGLGVSGWQSSSTGIFYNNGNVSIGSTTTTYKLSVNGDSQFQGDIYLTPNNGYRTGISAEEDVRFFSGGYSPLYLGTTGRVGINLGISTKPSESLDVSGNIAISGNFVKGGYTLTLPSTQNDTLATLNGIESLANKTLPAPVVTGGLNMSNSKITNLATPTVGSDAVTKDYADTLIHGLDWQNSVIDIDLTAPPGSPTTGDRYVVGVGATGAWSGHDNEITYYNGSGWSFIVPTEGAALWAEDANAQYVFNGSIWVLMSGGGGGNHSTLTNLSADDHTQYALLAGRTGGQTLVGGGASEALNLSGPSYVASYSRFGIGTSTFSTLEMLAVAGNSRITGSLFIPTIKTLTTATSLNIGRVESAVNEFQINTSGQVLLKISESSNIVDSVFVGGNLRVHNGSITSDRFGTLYNTGRYAIVNDGITSGDRDGGFAMQSGTTGLFNLLYRENTSGRNVLLNNYPSTLKDGANVSNGISYLGNLQLGRIDVERIEEGITGRGITVADTIRMGERLIATQGIRSRMPTSLLTLTGTIDPTASASVVGVGTAFIEEISPGDTLVVSGEARTVIGVSSNTTLLVDSAFSDNANDTAPKIRPANISLMLKPTIPIVGTTDGYFGIGTAKPTAMLHVQSDNDAGSGWAVKVVGGGATMTMLNKANANMLSMNTGQVSDGDYVMQIANSSGTIMTVLDSGRIGVSTASPSDALDIVLTGVAGSGGAIGSAKIGNNIADSSAAAFANRAIYGTTTAYALLQTSSGETKINAASGTTVSIQNAGVDVVKFNAAGEMVMAAGGKIKVGDGTTTAPSYTFLSEPSSGLLRQSSGLVGLAVSGSKVFDATATAITVYVPFGAITAVNGGFGSVYSTNVTSTNITGSTGVFTTLTSTTQMATRIDSATGGITLLDHALYTYKMSQLVRLKSPYGFGTSAQRDNAVLRWASSTIASVLWNNICWSPELSKFCAIAQTSSATSSDGVSWTSSTAGIDVNAWTSICWSPELGKFCSTSIAGTNRAMTSSDGVTWVSSGAANGVEASSWTSICWAAELGKFCAVANSGTNRTMTSNDGVTWVSSATGVESNNWSCVCWAAELGKFCAVANSGVNRTMTSSDGVTWSVSGAANGVELSGWLDVCWSSELYKFCAIAESGTNRTMTSSNGVTWVSSSTGVDVNGWNGICWSPELGKFCAVSYDGSNRIMTSSDGITWVSNGTGVNARTWLKICWSPELGKYCALATNSSTGIMTSNTLQLYNIPTETSKYNLGSSDYYWNQIYGITAVLTNITSTSLAGVNAVFTEITSIGIGASRGHFFGVTATTLYGTNITGIGVGASRGHFFGVTATNGGFGNIYGTEITSVGIGASRGHFFGVTATNGGFGSVYSTNVTSISIGATSAVLTNLISTNITSTNLYGITAYGMTGTFKTLYADNAIIGSLAFTNVTATNGGFGSVYSTNVTSISIGATNAVLTNLISTNVTSTNLYGITVYGVTGTFKTLYADNAIIGSLAFTNVTATNGGFGSVYSTNITSISIGATNAVLTNLISTNITSTNLYGITAYGVTGTFKTLYADNAIIGSLAFTDVTATNGGFGSVYSTNITSISIGASRSHFFGVTATNLYGTEITSVGIGASRGHFFGVTATTLYGTEITSIGIGASRGHFFGVIATNLYGTNITGIGVGASRGHFFGVTATNGGFGNIYGTEITSIGVGASRGHFFGVTATTLYSTEITSIGIGASRGHFFGVTATNGGFGSVYSTNVTSISIGATNAVLTNLISTNITSTNLVSGGITTSTFGGVSAVITTLTATTGLFTTLTSTTQLATRIDSATGGITLLDHALYTYKMSELVRLKTPYGYGTTAQNNNAVLRWTSSGSGVSVDTWRHVCWAPELNKFCVLAYNGSISMTSSDGVSWSTSVAGIDITGIQSMCWSPELGKFCAVAETGTNRTMTSSDGITWVSSASVTTLSWDDVCWSAELGIFCAVENSAASTMTSSDGVTWAISASGAVSCSGVCWSAELRIFCAVSQSGANRTMTSSNGITWSSSNSAAANSWQSICWSPELSKFCAVALSNTMTSSDGVTWANSTSGVDANTWVDVCWSRELAKFCSVAISGTNRLMISSDGVTWVSTNIGVDANQWYGVCWSPELGKFCAMASSGTNRTMTSNTLQLYNIPTETSKYNLGSSDYYWNQIYGITAVLTNITSTSLAGVNAVFTEITSVGIGASRGHFFGVTATNGGFGSVYSTNVTSISIGATNAVLTNLISTNITSTNLYGITAYGVTGTFKTLYADNAIIGSLAFTNVTATNGGFGSVYSTNITSISIGATNAVLTNLISTNITSTNLYGTTAYGVTGTFKTLYADNAIIGSLAFTDVTATNGGFGSVYSTNVTSISIGATNAVLTNLISTNITSTNIYGTTLVAITGTISTLYTTGAVFLPSASPGDTKNYTELYARSDYPFPRLEYTTPGRPLAVQRCIGRHKIAAFSPSGSLTSILTGDLVGTLPLICGIAVSTAPAVDASAPQSGIMQTFYTRGVTTSCGIYNTTRKYILGSVTGVGGFFAQFRFGAKGPTYTDYAINNYTTTNMFVGMGIQVAISMFNPLTQSTSCIGMGYHQGASCWHIYSCGNAIANQITVILGSNFIVNSTVPYQLTLYAPPKATTCSYLVEDLENGFTAMGVITSANLPVNTVLLAPSMRRQVSSPNAITAAIAIYNMVIETDY